MAWLRAGLFAFFLSISPVVLAEPLVVKVVSAEAAFDGYGESVVLIRLSPESASAFAELTAANIGRQIAIVVDGEAVSQPVVREPITGGLIQISSDFDAGEAEEIASRIAAGEAVVSFEPVAD